MTSGEKTRIGVRILVLIGLLGTASMLWAQEPVSVQTATRLNLRASASAATTSSILTVVPPGTTLTARAISPDRNWVVVDYPAQAGWLSLNFLTVLSGSLSSLPVSEQQFSPGATPPPVTPAPAEEAAASLPPDQAVDQEPAPAAQITITAAGSINAGYGYFARGFVGPGIDCQGDYRVIVYSHTDIWYIQPNREGYRVPLTTNCTWSVYIRRFSDRVAAYLVEADFVAPARFRASGDACPFLSPSAYPGVLAGTCYP